MTLVQILVLACVKGLAELLPVSSSAHVILAEKVMGLDPTSPNMTLLVMLHAGTMFAVIVYFWRSWRETYFASSPALRLNGLHIGLAALATGVTLAETTPVLEAANLQADLRRAGIEPWAWIVNNSVAAARPSPPLLRQRAQNEFAEIDAVARVHSRRYAMVPLLLQEPVGVDRLLGLTRCVAAAA